MYDMLQRFTKYDLIWDVGSDVLVHVSEVALLIASP